MFLFCSLSFSPPVRHFLPFKYSISVDILLLFVFVPATMTQRLHPATQSVRDYVTARDNVQFDGLADGTVSVHVSHSNLLVKMVELKLDLHAPVCRFIHAIHFVTNLKLSSFFDSFTVFLKPCVYALFMR